MVRHDVRENRVQNNDWRLRGINEDRQIRSVEVQQRLRLAFISVQPTPNHFLVGVVEAVVFQRPLLQTRNHLLTVRAAEMKNPLHLDDLFHQFGLSNVSRDAVEHEVVNVRFERMRLDSMFNARFPELNGDLIGHELALAGILKKRAPKGRPRVNPPEHIATGAMVKPRKAPECGSLSAFPAAGRTKEKVGGVSCWHNAVSYTLTHVPLQPRFEGFHPECPPLTFPGCSGRKDDDCMNLNNLTPFSTEPSTTKNILANDVEITGTLRFENELIFDGKLDGEIVSEGVLTLGKNAQVKGEVKTKAVTVHGTVSGNITVTERCELKASSQLNGDLKAMRIVIEEGATFIGKSEVTPAKTSSASSRGVTPATSDSPRSKGAESAAS